MCNVSCLFIILDERHCLRFINVDSVRNCFQIVIRSLNQFPAAIIANAFFFRRNVYYMGSLLRMLCILFFLSVL